MILLPFKNESMHKAKNSRYAYTKIFDANSLRERKELLNEIINNPVTSYLFFINCNPNNQEKEVAKNAFINNLDCCFKLLMNYDCDDDLRQEALATILNNPEYCYEIADKNKVTEEEKRIIYEFYREQYFDKIWENTDFFYKFFNTFKEFISLEEYEFLIDLIIDINSIELAEFMLLNCNILTENLKDKLESLLLINRLNKFELKIL